MFKLWLSIKKDLRILTRDRVGLLFMFVMPIILAIVITAIQNSTFELVNENKVPLLVCNKDTGEAGRQLVTAIEKIGMFNLKHLEASGEPDAGIKLRMHNKDALVGIVIPAHFTQDIQSRAKGISAKALKDFGMDADTAAVTVLSSDSVAFFYHPVLQQSFRKSVEGALNSALQLVQSKQIIRTLYFSLNEKEITDTLENEIAGNQVPIRQEAVSRDGSRNIPNATQHNIPAWTIFAMFFVVVSLGGSIVREKLNGSFVRLKTLPTNYMVALASKQLTYLCMTLLQTIIIFSIGIWLFPLIGLPKLNIPADLGAVFIVSLICGSSAISYASCVGVFANTQEQSNGFGAISVVLLAALGGVLVPAFAMPAAMQTVMLFSPMHWCLEAFYGLFLEAGSLKDVLKSLAPLVVFIVALQLLSLWRLKQKNLI